MQVMESERLRLRWFEPADAAFALELINEPAWKANISDAGVRDEAGARAWIEDKLLPVYWRQGQGFWLVERREDGVPLGLCGLIHRPGLPLPDLGYALLRRYWGHGYAREAARACLDYARRVLDLDALLATTAPHNQDSGRLLLDIGFVDEGLQSTEAYDEPSRLYRWRRPEPSPWPAGLEGLLARFWAVFDNRGGALPPLAALPALFAEDARIHVLNGGLSQHMDLRQFLPPRAILLMPGGRLREFHEQMSQPPEVRQAGGLAQVWMRYRKQGLLDGQPYGGEGRKGLQLLCEQGRWRIASLVWEDDAAPAQPVR